MPSHRVFSYCDSDAECICVSKENVLRQLKNAALNAWTGVELSEKAAEATIKVDSLKAGRTTKAKVWSLPDGLTLYQCISRDLHSSRVSLAGCGADCLK